MGSFGPPAPRLKLHRGSCEPEEVREASGMAILRGFGAYKDALREGRINTDSTIVTFSRLPSGQYMTRDYSPIDDKTLSQYGRPVSAKNILEGIDFAVK